MVKVGDEIKVVFKDDPNAGCSGEVVNVNNVDGWADVMFKDNRFERVETHALRILNLPVLDVHPDFR